MRGIIFRTYLNFIKDKYGYKTLDDILLKDEYPNKGGFSSAGNYSSSYLMSLVSNTTYLFGNSTDRVLEAFGIYSFKFLLDRFKKSYHGTNSPLHTNNAYNFLEELNIIHFDELRKIYPDARFPKFDIERLSNEHIVIEYSSNRNLPYFVYGLIKGCLKYFNDPSTLTMEKTKKTKTLKGVKVPVYRFEVKNNG
jgi:hypothetical protein